MTLEETLIKLGLEQKEAKIYLASLELGPATVLQIAKKAGIKRPTAYLVIDSLAEKGYFAKTQKQKKFLYLAEKPEALQRNLHNKEELLREAAPLLEAVMATAKDRPKIQIFEGLEGVKEVYGEIYESPEITFFGSIKDIQPLFADMLKKISNISKNKKPVIRDLLTSHPDDVAYAKKVIQENENYEVRLLPPNLNFSIDCAIYGNKVAVLAVKKDLFAVVIESKDVADSLRALHSLAWQSATPI